MPIGVRVKSTGQVLMNSAPVWLLTMFGDAWVVIGTCARQVEYRNGHSPHFGGQSIPTV